MKKNIVKFCLITTQRSGSSWLTGLLDSNPMIKSYGEIFIKKNREVKPTNSNLIPPLRYYRYKKKDIRPFKIFSYLNIIQSIKSPYKSMGFKLMYNQLRNYPEILIQLVLQKYKIIHLIRENFIDVIISQEIMKKSGIAHIKDETFQRPENKKIYLDSNKLLHNLQRHKQMINLMQHFLKFTPIEVLNVFYEELQEDKEKCLIKILRFLGIDNNFSRPLHSNHLKVNPGYHWEKIKNYNEIKNRLAGTEFYNLLHKKE